MASDKYVSRGGEKLKAALDSFKVNVSGKVCLDVGSSTGGFTDCLLQEGASKVYSVDTAYGELAWKLRNDPRVVVMERTNILYQDNLADINDAKVDLVVIDAGWTKLELVLPIIKNFLKENGEVVALLKPHYEGNKKDLIKGVMPENLAEDIKKEVTEKIKNLGFKVLGEIKSPILGGGGNTEYLLYLGLT